MGHLTDEFKTLTSALFIIPFIPRRTVERWHQNPNAAMNTSSRLSNGTYVCQIKFYGITVKHVFVQVWIDKQVSFFCCQIIFLVFLAHSC